MYVPFVFKRFTHEKVGVAKMQTLILKQLKKVEAENQVRILYACEIGSRAWGVATSKSDYDVRFIYVHPLDWYLSISDQRDVIELPHVNQLDMNGWELRKTLRLLRKSNPSLLEWLSSPQVYDKHQPFYDDLMRVSEKNFSLRVCSHHYLQMAKRNIRLFLHEEVVDVKKYFYVLRPIFACKWMEAYSNFPPLPFQQLVETLLEPSPLKQEINLLIYWRRIGIERTLRTNFLLTDEFIHRELTRVTTVGNAQKQQSADATSELDALFRQTLSNVWKN